MATENKELMMRAKAALDGKWNQAVLTYFIYFLITGVLSSERYLPLLSLIIGGPMAYGITIYSMTIARNETPKMAQIFEGFNQFGRMLITHLLMILFIVLWSLLLIVPGIIAAISYSQTYYILAEDNSIEPLAAIEKSTKMMYGYKWKYFCLGLRFIGWALLCLLTAGIGFLWLAPYMQVSFAKFYEDLKLESQAK